MSPPTNALSALRPHLQPVRLHLFSSHSWDHGYRREDMHELLAPDWIKGEDFHDHSVTAEHPIHHTKSEVELFDVLRDLILPCDVFLVFAGMEASHSEWMENEVKIARTLRVPIIAVIPNGQVRRSAVAMEYANAHANWRGASLRNAILSQLTPERRAAFQAKLLTRMLMREILRPSPPPAPLTPTPMIRAISRPSGYGRR